MSDHDPMCRQADTPLPYGIDGCDCDLIAKVRADEHGKTHVTSTGLSGRADFAQVRSQTLADLRAKVETLRARPIATFDGYTGLVALDQVLALLDGSNDA
jgi:hypothetical protein